MIRIKKLVIFLLLVRLILSLIFFLLIDVGFGRIVIGEDELVWQEASIFISDNLDNEFLFPELFAMESSYNNLGWPFLMGIFLSVSGLGYFSIYIVKSVLLAAAVFCLYNLLESLGYSKKLILVNICFLLFYYPLLIFHSSFLRDDVIVYLIIISSYLLISLANRFNILILIILLLSIWILLFSRIFSVAIVVYIFFSVVKFNKKNLLYFIPIFLLLFYFDLINYILLFFANGSINVSNLFYNIFKFYIGPLPWNMIYHDSEYEPWWYFITFLVVFLFLFSLKFWRLLYENRIYFFVTFFFIFLPYHIRSAEHDSIGPRQFAMVAPFFFFFIYSKLLIKIKLI
jgi:hypothetical protein